MLYGWKENAMLTNCLAACANLSITISEIQRYICEKIVILSYPLAFDAPVRGSCRNIGIPFGMEKLEWCRYPTVKNSEDIFIRFDVIHECDGQTDIHCVTAKTALASHRAVMNVPVALYLQFLHT